MDDLAAGQRALGERLRALREEAGLSLPGLARECGLSKSHIGDVELGRRLPSLRTIVVLADALGTSVVRLLRGIAVFDDDTR